MQQKVLRGFVVLRFRPVFTDFPFVAPVLPRCRQVDPFFAHRASCNGHPSIPEGFYHPDLPRCISRRTRFTTGCKRRTCRGGCSTTDFRKPCCWKRFRIAHCTFIFHPIARFYEMCANPNRVTTRYRNTAFLSRHFAESPKTISIRRL